MNPLEILLLTADRLNQLNIPFMITGAFAVSFYGRPRSTHDIDLIVELCQADIAKIYKAFEEDFYASTEMMAEAVTQRSMFNLIHNETATKVDIWMLEDTAFDRERFSRRVREVLRDVAVCISSPEDMIVVKLNWFKQTEILKHYEDALGIVLVQQDALDIEYIRGWCERLFLGELLDRLLGETR
jgi:hypothetical protein